MPLLTIFTPTYNRAATLPRTYESLQNQTCEDFLWLIIDDGSTDNTQSLVQQWQQSNNRFEIRYHYKENGGLHTGYNAAIELADTELIVCIDSDDYMPENAVELILHHWLERGNSQVAGLIGMDYSVDGCPVGTPLPKRDTLDLVQVCVGKIPLSGDKKQVLRTDLLKKVAPMPVFPGEKNFNPYYLILQVAKEYPFLVLDAPLCIVDYQSDGMTANQWKQYINSPRSFFETRKLYLSLPGSNLKYRLRHSIHMVSSAILAGKPGAALAESPCPLVTLLTYPLGILLSIWLRSKSCKQ